MMHFDGEQYQKLMEELMRYSEGPGRIYGTRPETQTDKLEKERDAYRRQVEYLKIRINDLQDQLRQLGRVNERLRQQRDFGRINITDLIKLCHPDRHDNSPLANAITQELIILRKR